MKRLAILFAMATTLSTAGYSHTTIFFFGQNQVVTDNNGPHQVAVPRRAERHASVALGVECHASVTARASHCQRRQRGPSSVGSPAQCLRFRQ